VLLSRRSKWSELVCGAEEGHSVTHLRQIMPEKLRRPNYPESTIHTYVHTVEHFSRHFHPFHRPPDQLGPGQSRPYQAALFTRWKLAPNT
jgi:integrase/recombinase XerD